MNYYNTLLIIVLSLLLFTLGCAVLFTEQEWSENYALLDGVQSTSPIMIDGDVKTIGQPSFPAAIRSRVQSPEVIITLPEKKVIRKIVIHSDNLKKLVIFANQGGTIHSKTDWQLVKEIKSVKSYPLEIPFLYSHPTDKLRIVILDTSDDAAAARKEKAEFYSGSESSFRFGRPTSFYGRSYNNARIGEIEIYGYKSAADTAVSNSESDKTYELDEILE